MDPKTQVFPYVCTPYLVLITVFPHGAVVIRTQLGPKNHVFPYVYTPSLVLIYCVPPRGRSNLLTPKHHVFSNFTHHIWFALLLVVRGACHVAIRNHDGPKNHVLTDVYTPY